MQNDYEINSVIIYFMFLDKDEQKNQDFKTQFFIEDLDDFLISKKLKHDSGIKNT